MRANVKLAVCVVIDLLQVGSTAQRKALRTQSWLRNKAFANLQFDSHCGTCYSSAVCVFAKWVKFVRGCCICWNLVSYRDRLQTRLA